MKKVLVSSTVGAALAFGAITSVFAAESAKTAPVPVKTVQSEHQSSMISLEQAKKIALKRYPGTIKSIQLKIETGKKVYSIYIEGKKDRKTVLVKVDAKTGKITYTQVLKVLYIISEAKVKQIALKEVAGSVKSVQLNKVSGKDIYTVAIVSKADGKTHTVKVNARTGVVLRVQ